MVPASTREFLELLLEDGELTFDELNAFVDQGPREDLFLDYKDGKTLEDVKEARQIVRRWVSGFANADGGVLVIGFDESKPLRQLSPCIDRVGGDPLDTWASKTLSGLEGFLSPSTRFKLIPVGSGRCALLIATARAPQLVPCYEAGEVRYYLRFHDSTRAVPAYLISDLLLGRRQRAALALTLLQVSSKRDHYRGISGNPSVLNVSIKFRLENVSLVVADDLDVAIVGWTLSESRAHANTHLLGHVDAGSPPTSRPPHLTWILRHAPFGSAIRRLPPFDVFEGLHHGAISLPVEEGTYRCGMYVRAAGAPPSWFQFQTGTNGPPLNREATEFLMQPASLTPLSPGKRPVLSYEET